jgi:hypothetical protein
MQRSFWRTDQPICEPFWQPSRARISHQRDRLPRFISSVGTNARTIRYASVEDLAA